MRSSLTEVYVVREQPREVDSVSSGRVEMSGKDLKEEEGFQRTEVPRK